MNKMLKEIEERYELCIQKRNEVERKFIRARKGSKKHEECLKEYDLIEEELCVLWNIKEYIKYQLPIDLENTRR